MSEISQPFPAARYKSSKEAGEHKTSTCFFSIGRLMKQVNKPVTWLHNVTFIQSDISGPFKSFPTELCNDLGYAVFIQLNLFVAKVQRAKNVILVRRSLLPDVGNNIAMLLNPVGKTTSIAEIYSFCSLTKPSWAERAGRVLRRCAETILLGSTVALTFHANLS